MMKLFFRPAAFMMTSILVSISAVCMAVEVYTPERGYGLLEYNQDYMLDNGAHLKLHAKDRPEKGAMVDWMAEVNNHVSSESIDFRAPDCYLVTNDDGSRKFLYMTLPVGDVSYGSYIYEIKNTGLKKLGRVDAAICKECDMRANAIPMALDDYYISNDGMIMLMPSGTFHVKDNGYPDFAAAKSYTLKGPELITYRPLMVLLADRDDSGITNGSVELPNNSVLKPYRTDKKSYLDFMSQDGRICRFHINGFGPDMLIDGVPLSVLLGRADALG